MPSKGECTFIFFERSNQQSTNASRAVLCLNYQPAWLTAWRSISAKWRKLLCTVDLNSEKLTARAMGKLVDQEAFLPSKLLI
ncbi:hypothetical protein T4A_5181 [Trichinella pseudospiralis]|uniref:Uncharacterized protein n=1 Tax=Trichinella pseudospiralis TaxID=6337 RepID=A0A0V1ENV2_TRIPS|nr:hypothetical protein T4A_5181 [Trichinella pseudospiralis]